MQESLVNRKKKLVKEENQRTFDNTKKPCESDVCGLSWNPSRHTRQKTERELTDKSPTEKSFD